jgi:hypothetical protein
MNDGPYQLGDRVDQEKTLKMAPPVVMMVQPDSFVRLETPEALKSWEQAVKATTGLDLAGDRFAGSASESCSAGCTDDSDMC